MRAFDVAQSVPWVITEPALHNILRITNREDIDIAAVEARLGHTLDNSRTVTMRDGVATIPVTGPIFRRADLFTELSGATSTETMAKDLTTALDDPDVGAIILDIDSPGGEAFGVAELSAMIYAARGQKPITAYVDGLGASAAYWIASAADDIVLSTTAFVGSIGAVIAVRDPTKAKSADIEFVSSQSPNKRSDPTTERGKNQIQAIVDALASVFVADVARYRAVTEETVLSDFGQGALVMGQSAVDAGMADRIGSYESLLAHMAEKARAPDTNQKPQGWIGRLAALAGSPHTTGDSQMDWKSFFTVAKEAGVTFDAPPTQETPDHYTALVPQAPSAEFLAAQRRATEAEAKVAEYERKAAAYEAQAQARADVERTATVSAAVERVISAHKALPAAREALTADFALAADDDAARPVADGQPTRVARLESSYATNKAHPLTRELIHDQHGVLPASAVMGTPDDDTIAQAVATAKAYAEQMNKAEANARAAKGGK